MVLFQIFFDEKDIPAAEKGAVEEEFKPKRSATTFKKADKAPNWYQDNRIVLDGDNHPIKQYREIPAVCSSEMEGWLMVAIRRLNPSITTQDFRARMPHFRSLKPNGQGEKKQWSLQAHSMRQTRFQSKAGCLALESRAGSDTIKEYLMRLLPADCKARNSTEGFRDLTDAEVDAMKSANKGGFSYRGKRKADSEGGVPRKRIKCMDKIDEQHTSNKEQENLKSIQEGSRFGQPRSHEEYDTGNPQGQIFNGNAFQDIHDGVVGDELNLLPYKGDTESTKEPPTTKRKRMQKDDSGDSDKEYSPKPPKRLRHISPIATIQAHHLAKNNDLPPLLPPEGYETGTTRIARYSPTQDDRKAINGGSAGELQPQTTAHGNQASDPILGGYENEDGFASQETTEPSEDFLTALYFELIRDETQALEPLPGNEAEVAEAAEENAIDPRLLDPALHAQETSTEMVLPQQTEPVVSENPVATAITEEQVETPPPVVQPGGFSLDFLEQSNGYFDHPLPEVDFFDAAYESIYGAFVRDD